MRLPLLLALLLFCATAHADPPGDGIRKTAERELPGAVGEPGEADPFFHLESHMRLTVDDLDSKLGRFERRLDAGGAHLVLTTDWREVDHAVPLRGWRTGVAGSYNIAGVTVAASAGIEHVDTDLGRGTLTTAGIAVGKSFQLARGVRAWLGISLGQRRWVGQAPAGEPNVTHVLLGAKLTY